MNWNGIEERFVGSAQRHFERCQADGLSCPFDVFEQLLHDHHEDRDFAVDLQRVDWSGVQWRLAALSGVKLRQVAVPRGYQYAVDEARARSYSLGITDMRDAVVASWEDQLTWLRPPVAVEGSVLGSCVELALLDGFTRLGDLLGMLDRGEVPEAGVHRVWVGTSST